MWLFTVACQHPPAADKGADPHSGTPAPTGETGPTDTGSRPGPDLLATVAANYTLTQSFTVPEVEVHAAPTSLLLSWSGLTVDAWGDPVVASDLGRLLLMEVTVPPSEIGERLAKDDLGFDLLSTWEADITGRVFLNADELLSGAIHFDPAAFLLEDPGRSWVLGVADVVDGAPRLRSAVVVVPQVASAGSSVALADGGATFGWSAALDGTPLVTSSAWDAWTLDWDGVGTDAFGRAFDDRRVDELFVGRYAAPASALGAAARDLPGAAEAVWRLEVGGFTDARLELARDAGGTNFPGFGAGETWVVGLRCRSCLTPFPAYAAVVEVR